MLKLKQYIGKFLIMSFIILTFIECGCVYADSVDENKRYWFGSNSEKMDFLENSFKSEGHAVPQLAWFIPGKTIISDWKFDSIYVYSSVKGVLEAKYLNEVTRIEAKNIGKKYGMPCNGDSQNELYYIYEVTGEKVKLPTEGERVFISNNPFKEAKIGYEKITPDAKMIQAAAEAAGCGNYELKKDLFLRADGNGNTISFHAFYNKKSQFVERSCIIFWGVNNIIKGIEKESYDPDEEFCADCAFPLYSDPIDYVYLPINIMVTSDYPNPIIVLNTGTIEGRALSLVTFDGTGKYSAVRAYEYVYGCY